MKYKTVFLVGVILLMIILSSFLLVPDIEEYFWGGSNYVFADLIVLKALYPFLITISLIFILFFSKRKFFFSLPIILIMFFVWTLSGRVIGMRVENDNCELISGWFYVATGFFNTNTKTTINNEIKEVRGDLKFKYLNFWRLEIEKGNFKETIFIGPFLWKNIKKIVNKVPSSS